MPLFVRTLGDRNPELQQAAGNALLLLGEAGFQATLRAAAHGTKRQREEAVVALGAWGDVRAVGPLLLALHHDGKERRLRNLRLFLTMVGYQIVRDRSRLGGRLALEWESISPAARGLTASPLPNEGRYGWNWYLAAKQDVVLRTRAAAALGRLGDVRAVVPLIRLMHDGDLEVVDAAQNALCLLMPIAALSPALFRSLGEAAPLALAGLLSSASEPLARSTLAALCVCCDPRTLPAVQRLAEDPTRPVVQAAAIHLASQLHERAAQQQMSATLLRASTSPHGSDPDQLLRAAQGTLPSTTDGSQLLRPTGAEQTLDVVNF